MNPRHAERAGQESRLPPAAGGRRDSWRSSQRRQRRAGAAVGFGNCKRACEASSSPSAPAKRQFSPVGLSCFFVRANRRRTSNPKDLAFALCKVLTGTGSGAKIVQQSFCPLKSRVRGLASFQSKSRIIICHTPTCGIRCGPAFFAMQKHSKTLRCAISSPLRGNRK